MSRSGSVCVAAVFPAGMPSGEETWTPAAQSSAEIREQAFDANGIAGAGAEQPSGYGGGRGDIAIGLRRARSRRRRSRAWRALSRFALPDFWFSNRLTIGRIPAEEIHLQSSDFQNIKGGVDYIPLFEDRGSNAPRPGTVECGNGWPLVAPPPDCAGDGDVRCRPRHGTATGSDRKNPVHQSSAV